MKDPGGGAMPLIPLFWDRSIGISSVQGQSDLQRVPDRLQSWGETLSQIKIMMKKIGKKLIGIIP